MRKNGQGLKGTVLGLLAIAGLIVLFLGLLYAGILCWAWFSDLKHADVAQDIIEAVIRAYVHALNGLLEDEQRMTVNASVMAAGGLI